VSGGWKKYRDEVRNFDKQKNSLHPVQKNYLVKKLEVEKKVGKFLRSVGFPEKNC